MLTIANASKRGAYRQANRSAYCHDTLWNCHRPRAGLAYRLSHVRRSWPKRYRGETSASVTPLLLGGGAAPALGEVDVFVVGWGWAGTPSGEKTEMKATELAKVKDSRRSRGFRMGRPAWGAGATPAREEGRDSV